MITFRIRNITPRVGIAALGILAGCSSVMTGGNRHSVQLLHDEHRYRFRGNRVGGSRVGVVE